MPKHYQCVDKVEDWIGTRTGGLFPISLARVLHEATSTIPNTSKWHYRKKWTLLWSIKHDKIVIKCHEVSIKYQLNKITINYLITAGKFNDCNGSWTASGKASNKPSLFRTSSGDWSPGRTRSFEQETMGCFCWRVENRTSVLAFFEACRFFRYMIFLLFSPTLHDLLLHRTCDGVGWGGDNTKQICCSATTWSSCFSLLRYMIFYFTEHVMGWGGAGIIPNRSVAPLLHDLFVFLS